jgi:hypothetical protein
MDKHKHTISNNNVPHREGFALIITLSALTVIIALTAVLISYIDEARKDSSTTKAMVQGNLYYADIKKILTKFKKKKSLYKTLYLSPIPFASPDGRFSIMLHCTPLANGVNINWIGLSNDQNMSVHVSMVQNIFESIVQEYNLEDGARLEEMILEEIGKKDKFVQKEQSRLLQKNGIISFKQFEGILNKYQFEVDDDKVGQVPWQKFFVFGKIEKRAEENLIDGDYISAELVSFLFSIDLATVKEEWVPGAVELKTFIQNNGGEYDQKLFAKEFLSRSQCKVQYDYEGERFAFKFEDIEGEVKNFEFSGKQ